MCELMAMSAKLPTDISFSFSGFVNRGGNTGPHKDGFGICFYESGGIREFKDYLPSCESPIARFLQQFPIKSQTVIAHIRQANVGEIALKNTHPFQREMCGRIWTFAHNGQMDINAIPEPNYYKPVGDTDSEKIFCWLLGELRNHCLNNGPMKEMASIIEERSNFINRHGVSNILMSDGESLFVFCSTKLHWITRKPPFGEAHLCDKDMTIDFSSVTTKEDIVSVITTMPLTDNEEWVAMVPGESRIFEKGVVVRHAYGPSIQHKKPVIDALVD